MTLPTYQSFTEMKSGGAGGNITKPSGTVEGDLLVLSVVNTGPRTVTSSGFTA